MATHTEKLEQNIAKILGGVKTTNIEIKYLWYGTSTDSENKAHEGLQAPVNDTRRPATQLVLANKLVVSDFINGDDAVTLFGNGTKITEYGAFFEPQDTGELAARHADTRADDYTANADEDLSVDFTFTFGE